MAAKLWFALLVPLTAASALLGAGLVSLNARGADLVVPEAKDSIAVTTTLVPQPPAGQSYAIFAEFAKANVLMKDGLNRRLFNTTEIRHGNAIALENDGSITLLPGTYHISGFSLVTMQISLTPPVVTGSNYPGYCLVYEKIFEDNDPLANHLCVGTPSTAAETVPSLFDFVFTCAKTTAICVGHQSGDNLNNEVYLDVDTVDTITSPYHVFARIAIFQL
jgi:hypothetical protein